jgi:DNA-binding GntR family transcriptional regulator
MALRAIGSSARITDVVFNELRNSILSGELAAGQQLSVPELARKFGVSRSPVREAVLQLVAHGLGQSEPRKGVVVAEFDEETMVGNHEIREVLEGVSARRAATRVTVVDLAVLDEIMARQASALQNNDLALYEETDAEFHRYVATICGHSGLKNFLAVLNDQMLLNSSVSGSRPDHIEGGYNEHLAVLEALQARDPVRAEEAMRRHIRNARMRLTAILSESRTDTAVSKSRSRAKRHVP